VGLRHPEELGHLSIAQIRSLKVRPSAFSETSPWCITGLRNKNGKHARCFSKPSLTLPPSWTALRSSETFGDRPVRVLRADEIEDWLHGLNLSPVSTNNYAVSLFPNSPKICAKFRLISLRPSQHPLRDVTRSVMDHPAIPSRMGRGSVFPLQS
jgi:hypothetical protein